MTRPRDSDYESFSLCDKTETETNNTGFQLKTETETKFMIYDFIKGLQWKSSPALSQA